MYTRSIFTGNGFGNIKNIIQSLLKISAIRFFVPISLGTVFRQQITLQQIRAICIILDGEPIINLPPKTIELKKVDFTMEERDFYCRLEADSRAQFAEYAAAGTIKQNYINILLMLLRLRQACDHPLLVSGSGSNSVWTSSVEMAKKLTPEKQVSLLNCLEASLAICGICNVDDKLYIYLEYVSGGSIYKLLQEYGLL